MIKKFITNSSNILIGGGMAFTFLKAKGINIGSSLVEDLMIDNIADWRMKYNFGTSSVDVFAGVDKTDDEAVQKQLDDNATEKAAEADREAARFKAVVVFPTPPF